MESALQNSLQVVDLVTPGNYLLAGEKLFSLIEFMQKWSRMDYEGKYLNCDSIHGMALMT